MLGLWIIYSCSIYNIRNCCTFKNIRNSSILSKVQKWLPAFLSLFRFNFLADLDKQKRREKRRRKNKYVWARDSSKWSFEQSG